MIEFLFAIFLEFILELFFVVLVDVSIHGPGGSIRNFFAKSAVIEATGYILIGLMLGGVSVLVFPDSFIGHQDLRLLNLIITPVLAGLVMMSIGALRTRKGQDLIRLDSFLYGALFAFSIAIVRFALAA
ncbi:MAG: hypothetical protein HKN33_12940 [Pyrinomonadaceae bacterium]|nr:hypothetical protein [Pyrinomonadaceae bacterium]